MKTFLLGIFIGALLTGGLSFWIKSDKPTVTQVCLEQEKIIQTKIVEKECPVVNETISEAKIEKAFMLFLASIGIKNNQKYSNDIKAIVKSPEDYEPEDLIESDSVVPVVTEFYYDKTEAIKVLKSSEAYGEIIDYFPEVKKAASFMLKDPAVYFARSKLIDKIKKLKRINGVYTGKLYRMTGKQKGKVEEVEMSVDFWTKEKNKIDGKFSMTIARDGVVYSNSRGNGGNNDIYLNPNDLKQVIIKGAPGMYFHFQDMKLSMANVYDEGEFIGVSTLLKQ